MILHKYYQYNNNVIILITMYIINIFNIFNMAFGKSFWKVDSSDRNKYKNWKKYGWLALLNYKE